VCVCVCVCLCVCVCVLVCVCVCAACHSLDEGRLSSMGSSDREPDERGLSICVCVWVQARPGIVVHRHVNALGVHSASTHSGPTCECSFRLAAHRGAI
jgi:hypothetical protein